MVLNALSPTTCSEHLKLSIAQSHNRQEKLKTDIKKQEASIEEWKEELKEEEKFEEETQALLDYVEKPLNGSKRKAGQDGPSSGTRARKSNGSSVAPSTIKKPKITKK